MADALVRTINLDYERFAPEVRDAFKSDPQRRGLVNETGFMLAKLRWTGADGDEKLIREGAYAAAVRSLAAIDAKANVAPLDEVEWQESALLGRRLVEFCNRWPLERGTEISGRRTFGRR
jgi:hypothetical protein